MLPGSCTKGEHEHRCAGAATSTALSLVSNSIDSRINSVVILDEYFSLCREIFTNVFENAEVNHVCKLIKRQNQGLAPIIALRARTAARLACCRDSSPSGRLSPGSLPISRTARRHDAPQRC